MNDVQKDKLCRRLNSLLKQIIVFVESPGETAVAVLDPADPRAGLRSCNLKTAGSAFFHRFYIDADQEPNALVEYPDGVVGSVWYRHVRFTDIPESGKE